MDINTIYGAYLIREDNNNRKGLLFIYMKLSKERLIEALPLSFNNETYENGNEEVGEWEETCEAENDLNENEPRFVAIG